MSQEAQPQQQVPPSEVAVNHGAMIDEEVKTELGEVPTAPPGVAPPTLEQQAHHRTTPMEGEQPRRPVDPVLAEAIAGQAPVPTAVVAATMSTTIIDNNAVHVVHQHQQSENAASVSPMDTVGMPPIGDAQRSEKRKAEEMQGPENRTDTVDHATATSCTSPSCTSHSTNMAAATSSLQSDVAADAMAKKKRLCRYPGCSKVIKSQGHCQRHGAKAKRCKIEGCDKQAQGTHDGMCKRHWKAANFPEEPDKKGTPPPEPDGESVYDSILPMSISYRPMKQAVTGEELAKQDLMENPIAPSGFAVMPLVAHLREGVVSGRPAGWHRNAERRARGMFPVKGLSVQLEPWERQLAMIEIMLLSGGTPYANFKDLSFAWGREHGFHLVVANSVCERRGEVERKKRSDCGKALSDDEKNSFRSKLQKTRDKNGTSKKARQEPLENMGSSGAMIDPNIATTNEMLAVEEAMPKIDPGGDSKGTTRAVDDHQDQDQEETSPAADNAEGGEKGDETAASDSQNFPTVFVV